MERTVGGVGRRTALSARVSLSAKDAAVGVATAQNRIALLGRLGVFPMVRLSLAGRRILAYLELRGEPVSRTAAADALWPDSSEEIGRANLRRGLWQLPRGWVNAVVDELILQAETDIARARGIAARAVKGERLNFDDIELLTNDILPGWHEEWVLPQHEAFHLLRVHALEAACRTLAASGDLALATQAGAAALIAEPLRESAAEALISPAALAQLERAAGPALWTSAHWRRTEGIRIAALAGLRDRTFPTP